MCGGVEIVGPEKTTRVYFPNPKAALPVLTKTGETLWVPWGRRREENFDLPAGGWARMDSLESGKWQRYHPRPVWIPIRRFMEKDVEKTSHWFDLDEGEYLRGVAVRNPNTAGEWRVYVVTTEADADREKIHPRLPLVMKKGNADAEDPLAKLLL